MCLYLAAEVFGLEVSLNQSSFYLVRELLLPGYGLEKIQNMGGMMG